MALEADRRQYTRYQRRDISLTLFDALGQIMDQSPVLGDISQGGAAITTRARVLPGETIKFQIDLPGGRQAIGHGKVRWLVEDGPSFAHRCGLEFIDFGWGGFSRLQAVLEPGAAGAVLSGGGESTPMTRAVDGMLMLGCLVVGFMIFRGLLSRPDVLQGMSGALTLSSLPLAVVAAAAFGIILLFRR